MSKPRVYRLELTAEELETYVVKGNHSHVYSRAKEALQQARADREADELRLPWKVYRTDCRDYKTWTVSDGKDNLGWGHAGQYTEAQVKLMSAAPELLEAVQAVVRWLPDMNIDYDTAVQPLIERALRKVDSGIPEGDK